MAAAEQKDAGAPPPGMRPRRRRWPLVLAVSLLLGLLTAVIRYGPSSEAGHALIERLASGVRVGDLGWLRLQGLRGDPWSEFGVRRLEIADRRGVWLSAQDVSARWRAWDLLARRLNVEHVTAGAITLVRQPVPLPSEGGGGGPMPVAVQIDRFAARVIFTPEFAWRRGDYRAEGRLDLERKGSAHGRLKGVSLDRAGDFVDVAFDVDRRTIAVDAHAREATGGAIAGSLGLDPTRPFVLDARASGTPRDGSFQLASAVGEIEPVAAKGTWTPEGGEMSGRLLLAASRFLAPFQAGLGPTIEVRLTARRLSDRTYHAQASATGARASVDVAGDIEPGRQRIGPAGLAVNGRLADLSALAGAPGFGPATFRATLRGDPETWRLDGQGAVEQISLGGARLTRVSGPVQVSAAPTSLSVKADLIGVGQRDGGALSSLIGPAPRASGEVDWLPRGRVLIRRLTLKTAALDAEGHGDTGLFGGLSFTGQARLHDFAGPSGGVRGLVLSDWKASQAREDAPWSFSLRSRGQGLRLPMQALDTLLGPTPALSLEGRAGAEGVALTKAVLQGAALKADGAGSLGAKGELKGSLAWSGKGPVDVGVASLTGAMTGRAALSGALVAPHLVLSSQFAGADLSDSVGLRLRGARLDLDASGRSDGWQGHFGFAADSDHGPALAQADVSATGGLIALSGIALKAGGVDGHGEASFSAGRVAKADLTVTVGPGLYLAKGRLDGRLQVEEGAPAAHARVRLSGSGLTLADGATDIDSLTLAAEGPLDRLPYRAELRGNAVGLRGSLSGTGTLHGTADALSASFSGSGRIGAADVRTMAPAEVAVRGSGLTASARLSLGKGGRADVSLSATPGGIDGRATLAALDIGLLNPDIVGRLDGALSVHGQGHALTGRAQLHLADLTARDLEGEAPLTGSLDIGLETGVVNAAAQLTDGRGSKFAADVRLPATLSADPFALEIQTRQPMSGHFAIDGAVAPIWDLAQGGAQSLSGHLTASGVIGGTFADPRLNGVAALDNGEFEDAGAGLRLRGVKFSATLEGDAIDVAGLTGTDGDRGQVTGSGRISLLRGGASGFRADLKGFRLIDNQMGQATASGRLSIERGADGKVRLAGSLNIDHAQISPNQPAPSGVVPMDVVEVHRKQEQSPFLPQPAERDPPVVLDVGLKAPGGLFIRGRGLNLELSLDAHVGGTVESPVLTGVARVVRGDYDFAGKRFQMDDTSTVRLGSTPETIRLDLTATREDPALTAVVKIQGTAAAPTLALSSTPALPKDEILSQVLFGSSAAQLTGLEAAQLASAVAGLAGNGGFDVIGGLRTFAHLDRLAIESNALTGFKVSGGKYVTDRVYVELSDSAKTGQGAQVEWRLKRHLAIVSRVTSQGDQALSIRWRRDY